MVKIPFKWYLHESGSMHECQDELESQVGLSLTDEDMEKIGRPFYEVTLNCVLDTDTMQVTLTDAHL